MKHIIARNRLRVVRCKLGYSVGELAKLTGLSVATISRIERNVSGVSPKNARKITEALEVDFEEIFTIAETSKEE